MKFAVSELGHDALVIDIDDFATDLNLKTKISSGGSGFFLQTRLHNKNIDLSIVPGLWWRRPYAPGARYRQDRPHNIFTVVRDERRSALVGSLEALVRNAFNHQGCSRAAGMKPSQLVRAVNIGLQIPETLISNDPLAVRDFHERLSGQTIYKMFNGSPFGLYGTRRLEEEDLARLYKLPECPAIFQEFVAGEYDVRAIVVGDRVFAARLDYQPLEQVIDTRFVETQISAHKLPVDVEEKLVRLVADFGLVYSAIDLRYSRDRGYVFFELNPEGQYLWLEIESDLPISRAIAERLIGVPDTSRVPSPASVARAEAAT